MDLEQLMSNWNPLTTILTVAVAGLLVLLAILIVYYKRNSKKLQDSFDEFADSAEIALAECQADNKRLANEAGDFSGDLITFFLVYRDYLDATDTQKGEMKAEMQSAWKELPRAAQDMLKEHANDVGLRRTPVKK